MNNEQETGIEQGWSNHNFDRLQDLVSEMLGHDEAFTANAAGVITLLVETAMLLAFSVSPDKDEEAAARLFKTLAPIGIRHAKRVMAECRRLEGTLQ